MDSIFATPVRLIKAVDKLIPVGSPVGAATRRCACGDRKERRATPVQELTIRSWGSLGAAGRLSISQCYPSEEGIVVRSNGIFIVVFHPYASRGSLLGPGKRNVNRNMLGPRWFETF
jgi:hypothetical protein